MCLAKRRTALLTARVEHRTVGKNDARRHHHVIRIGMHATTHAGGIVDDNATDHGAVDGSGIGR